MTRTRGDAIQLIGLNTRTGAASAIGIPRDAWVPIPGFGSNRVNASLTYGGPALMGRTVGNLVGVQPDYVMVTRFPFFENMINDIGGIYVDNPRPFSDSTSSRRRFEQGQIKLNGYRAMAFSRIRKSLAGGDFDRSANQQRVLRGIQSRIATRADQPGLHRARGAVGDAQHGHQPVAGRALRAGPGRRPGRPPQDPHLRRQRLVRQHRRRQHHLPERQPGPPLRQRRPSRRVPRPLLTGGLVQQCGGP